MNRFELIEKLRERADINYEEAEQLLSDTQDDLIAALIILEKQGRLKGMQQSGTGRMPGADDARTEAGTKKSRRSVIGHAFRTFGNFIAHTTFHMAHGENEILVLPTFVFALILLFFWQTLAPLMLISLFFKVHYYFDGTASTKAANDFIDQAEELATDFDFMPARKMNSAGADTAQSPAVEPYQTAGTETGADQTSYGEGNTNPAAEVVDQGQEVESPDTQTAPAYETYPPYDPEIENVSDHEF